MLPKVRELSLVFLLSYFICVFRLQSSLLYLDLQNSFYALCFLVVGGFIFRVFVLPKLITVRLKRKPERLAVVCIDDDHHIP